MTVGDPSHTMISAPSPTTTGTSPEGGAAAVQISKARLGDKPEEEAARVAADLKALLGRVKRKRSQLEQMSRQSHTTRDATRGDLAAREVDDY